MSAPRRHLLLERGGVLWGIASHEVRRVRRHSGGLAVQLASGEELAADDARGVVADLAVTPPAPLLARFWPQPVLGLATHEKRPLVVVGGGALPAALRAPEAPAGAVEPPAASGGGEKEGR